MLLSKNTLKYKLLRLTAEAGDVFLEFLLNDVAKGKRIYLGRKRYRSDYCLRLLKELTTTGYIERVEKNGIQYLRLTPHCSKMLKRDIPLLALQKQKWGGHFHGLAYDFPEKKSYQRNQLRNLAKTWGLGQFQLSLWITAHPLEEIIDDFITSNNLQDFAFRFTTKKLTKKQGQTIAEKVWNLPKLEKTYWNFINGWWKKDKEGKLKAKNQPIFEQEYFHLLDKDPHLPYDLLPIDWPAKDARQTYIEIKERLKKLEKL